MRTTTSYRKMAKQKDSIKVDTENVDYDNFQTRGIRNFALAVLNRAMLDARGLKTNKICRESRAWLSNPSQISIWCHILDADPESFSESIKKCLNRYDQKMVAFVYFFPYSWLLYKAIFFKRREMNWKKIKKV